MVTPEDFGVFSATGVGDSVDEREFTVTGLADVDEVVIDADGAPTADFGIGGETYFVNPALDVEAQATAALIGDTIDIDVQVLDEAAGDELEVAGIGIDVIVADGVETGPYNDVGAGAVLASDAIVTGDDGVATFTLTDLGAEVDTATHRTFDHVSGNSAANCPWPLATSIPTAPTIVSATHNIGSSRGRPCR